MRAAALAFNSLLALVPVLALATAITAAVTNDKSESVQKFVSQVIVSVLPASANQKEPEVAGRIDEIRKNLGKNIINFINK